MEQYRLSLICLMMCQGDAISPLLRCNAGQRNIALTSHRFFESDSGIRIDVALIQAMNRDRGVESSPDLLHRVSGEIGMIVLSVVDVSYRKGQKLESTKLGKDPGQSHGVLASAASQQHMWRIDRKLTHGIANSLHDARFSSI